MSAIPTPLMPKKRLAKDPQVPIEPAVIDGKTGAVLRRVRVPLRTLMDARRYVARTIRRVEGGELTVEEGNGRVFMAKTLAWIIGEAEIEKDLAEVEKLLERGQADAAPAALPSPADDQ